MFIYDCKICRLQLNSLVKLSRHITHQHRVKIREYYDKYLISETPKCRYCDEIPVFKNLAEGYKQTCKNHYSNLRSDSAKEFRIRLKDDEGKFNSFVEKVKQNQTYIWANRTDEQKNEIAIKSSTTTKLICEKLTVEERKQKYSRYFTCDVDTIERLNKEGRENCLKNWKEGKSGYGSNMKGKFKPRNPSKYKGDPSNIIYRSSYELKYMMKLDADNNIKWWQSEELIIPYKSPIDNKTRRYFPDFVFQDVNGQTFMVEIKPAVQTKPPVLTEGKKKTKKYINEVMTWGVNEAKWKYATEYCLDRGWKFVILTEYELGIKF